MAERAGRRAPVWVLVALLVGAGAGAAVTARHAAATERVRAEADRGARAVLALQAGRPSLQSGAPLPGPQGSSTLRLNVPLSNRGADRVRITVRALDVRGRAPLPVAADVSPLALAPGATTTASVPVVVRCADVGPGAGSAGARHSALRVSVEAPGGSRRAALPLEDSVPGSVRGLLSYACGPPEQRRAPLPVTWTPRDDGSLEVAVAPAFTERLVLDLRQSPGLGVRSDLALPSSAAPASPTVMVLTMTPTCAVAAPPGRVPTAGFEVVTLAEGGRVQAAVPDDDGVKAAWTARQLALRCG